MEADDALDHYTIDYMKHKADEHRERTCSRFTELFLASVKESIDTTTIRYNEIMLRRIVTDYARNYCHVMNLGNEILRLTPFNDIK
jgi:hypothetical protein